METMIYIDFIMKWKNKLKFYAMYLYHGYIYVYINNYLYD